MSDDQKLYYVTKNGVKVTAALPLEEANKQASDVRKLQESSGESSAIAVVPLLLG
jgi:hypothetical protein